MSEQTPQQNRLAQESSPYLRQHATNPVDWYPWGPEALEKAKNEDKPIFLSIGYSACHWCHVMEHESFENLDIANILNAHFVSIKVDREERPDLDQIYMLSVQMITGQGGWPMSVFLTPELRPFYGGTYFPPESRYGRPGFKELTQHLAQLWQTDRARAEDAAANLTEHLQKVDTTENEEQSQTLDESVLQRSLAELGQRFDPIHGGFGQPPKFLHTMDMRLLLRVWHRFDMPDALHMVRHTLDKMAMGGIYDHLGGGFARYSTDARWFVPHFEKMLYDNALLLGTYLEAYQATHEPFYREIVEETLTWVEREMTSEQGPFFSTLDADSEGVEGKFYVWQQAEIEELLGEDESALFNAVYNVRPQGNWEGNNILHRTKTWAETAEAHSLDEETLQSRLTASREKLFNVRSKRIWPGRDEKVLTAWNGLMIAALAEAAQILDETKYAEMASKAANFILENMRQDDGRLYRTWSAGAEAKLNAYLEDYAFLADGLISLYEATFEPSWIETAYQLCEIMIEQFYDQEQGGFYFTGKDHEALITRNRDFYDGAVPSGNAMAATALIRLSRLTAKHDWQPVIDATIEACSSQITRHATSASQMLIALDFQIGPSWEIALIGNPEEDETQQALRMIRDTYQPRKVIALSSSDKEQGASIVGLLQDKKAENGLTTYLCQNGTCQAPIVGIEKLQSELSKSQSGSSKDN